MKTMKTIFTMVLLVAVTTVSFAGDAAMDAAKKDLTEQLTTALKENMKPWNNYFYKNEVSSVKEKVVVSVYVDEDQDVKLLHVKCCDQEAAGYVKHVLKKEHLKASKLLVGKGYRFNVLLKYDAR